VGYLQNRLEYELIPLKIKNDSVEIDWLDENVHHCQILERITNDGRAAHKMIMHEQGSYNHNCDFHKCHYCVPGIKFTA
jgi:hypothetical protein